MRGIRALGGRCFAFVALTTISKFLTLRLRRLGTLFGALTSIFGRQGFLLSGGSGFSDWCSRLLLRGRGGLFVGHCVK